jgi:N-methylhydantoinase A
MEGYICPASAGVASALGFLTAPASFEFARTHIARIQPMAMHDVDEVYQGLREEGRATLADAGVPEAEMRFVRQADLRHVGQGHEIVVELPDLDLTGEGVVEALRERFFEAYEGIYGHAHRHLDLEITTCRLTASGPKPRVTLEELSSGGTPEEAVKGSRPAFFAEAGGFVETPLYDRSRLAPGSVFAGPAIVEEVDSTAVIGPGTTVTVDAYANLVVTFDPADGDPSAVASEEA